MSWPLAALVACLGLYAAFVAGLVVAGRRDDARALAGFIPDCLVLVRRLMRDPRVPRSRRALPGAPRPCPLLAVDVEREAYASIVDHAEAAVVTVGLDGRVLTWNRAAEPLFGARVRRRSASPSRRSTCRCPGVGSRWPSRRASAARMS